MRPATPRDRVEIEDHGVREPVTESIQSIRGSSTNCLTSREDNPGPPLHVHRALHRRAEAERARQDAAVV